MPKYQGHKNWNHWNVSLWLNNDEGLYNLVQSFRQYGKDVATLKIYEALKGSKTPDGAPYSKSAIRAAIRD